MSLRIDKILACIRHAGPYLAIELILPGGSIVALILWLIRNRASVRQTLARIRSRARNVPQFAGVLGASTASTA
jgi:hypothetical protein